MSLDASPRPLRSGSILLALVILAGAGGAAEGSEPVAPSGEPDETISETVLFVTIQDEARVALVDMDRLEVLEVIDLGEMEFGSRSMPHDVAIPPDGSQWFVSLIGEDTVLRFDAANRLLGSFELETPGMLDMDPEGERLIVSRSMSAVNPPARIGVVPPETMDPLEIDVLFPRPHGVVVDRDGRYAYTASLGENRLASIALASERVELIDVPGPTHAFVQLALSPDGEVLVASGEMSGELVIFDLAEPSRPAPMGSVEVGLRAFDPVFHPDGGTVWLPVKSTDEVVVVETAEWSVVDRIEHEALVEPHAIRFSPDGSRAFVTNNAGPDGAEAPAALVTIDVEARRVEGAIELGRNLTGIERRPSR